MFLQVRYGARRAGEAVRERSGGPLGCGAAERWLIICPGQGVAHESLVGPVRHQVVRLRLSAPVHEAPARADLGCSFSADRGHAVHVRMTVMPVILPSAVGGVLSMMRLLLLIAAQWDGRCVAGHPCVQFTPIADSATRPELGGNRGVDTVLCPVAGGSRSRRGRWGSLAPASPDADMSKRACGRQLTSGRLGELTALRVSRSGASCPWYCDWSDRTLLWLHARRDPGKGHGSCVAGFPGHLCVLGVGWIRRGSGKPRLV